MSAADFATARRGITSESIAYARAAMEAGHGYQGAAAMIGVAQEDLKAWLPDPRPRRRALPPFTRKPAEPVAVVIAEPEPEPEPEPECEPEPPAIVAPAPLLARDIIAIVCEYYDISHEVMIGPLRVRSIARPRQRACFLIHEYRPAISYPEMGRIMGGRDHTTAMHAVRKIAELIAASPEEADEVNTLRAIIDARIAEGAAG